MTCSTTNLVQTTIEGTEVITVGRSGTASKGRFSYAIYHTAVYRAVRRQADGVLTWRKVSYYRDDTSGRGITGPMIERAQAKAAERGCEYRVGVRHGDVCE